LAGVQAEHIHLCGVAGNTGIAGNTGVVTVMIMTLVSVIY